MTRAQILALGTQTNTRLLQASDTGEFYAIEAGQSGSQAKPLDKPVVEVSGSANIELTAPVGTYTAGNMVMYHVKSTGGGNLTLSGISVPTDSGIVFPKALAAQGTYIVQLSYVGGVWGVVTVVGAF